MFDKCDKAWELVKTVDIVNKEGQRRRIEVFKNLKDQSHPYVARLHNEAGGQKGSWRLDTSQPSTTWKDTADQALSEAVTRLA